MPAKLRLLEQLICAMNCFAPFFSNVKYGQEFLENLIVHLD